MNATEALVEILQALNDDIKTHKAAVVAAQDTETRLFIAGGLYSLEMLRGQIRELAKP
jgi:hypothetical protein